MTDVERFNEVFDTVLAVAKQKVKGQAPEGSFPAGHNGPHGDEETPVRNTSHWLYALCALVDHGHDELTGHAERAADYLVSQHARPMGAAFWCRKNPEKDFQNGLVGQAWAMEGLLKAANTLNRQDCLEAVKAVFYKHEWSEQRSAWHTLNVDGSNGGICVTFNQQLWFACIACLIGDEESTRRAKQFLDNVLPRVELYPDGVIYHDALAFNEATLSARIVKRDVIGIAKQANAYLIRRKKRDSQRARSVGYHGFNLVALVALKETFPRHPFWASKSFTQMAEAPKAEAFLKECEGNVFSYPYNPTGFELAYFYDAIGEDAENVTIWIKRQMRYLQSSPSFSVVDSKDDETSLARIYEVCR